MQVKISLLLLLLLPISAQAIVPPDILFSLGTQFAQFFSLIAFVVGGLFMSVAVGFSPYVNWVRSHLLLTLSMIGLVTVMTVSVINHFQYQSNQATYQEKVAELERQLGVSPADGSTEVVDSTEGGEENQKFRSDTLFFYTAEPDSIYLELDLNRKQNPNGGFLHYYYLHGWIGGESVAEYHTYTSTSSDIQTKGFLKEFFEGRSPDASTRRSYQGVIEVNGDLFTFSTDVFRGDFITKDQPTYTRIHSAETANISYRDYTSDVFVLSESIYSEDYGVSVFFSGQSAVEAVTHQFVLWDELGDFYLLDNSQVFSNTPAYPSHTWLLHKNQQNDTNMKSYTASIDSDVVDGLESSWQISMPEFGNAQLSLIPEHYIDKNNLQSRQRTLVSGSIIDDNGARQINGFLHYID